MLRGRGDSAEDGEMTSGGTRGCFPSDGCPCRHSRVNAGSDSAASGDELQDSEALFSGVRVLDFYVLFLHVDSWFTKSMESV